MSKRIHFFKVTMYEDDCNGNCTVNVTIRTNLEILACSEEYVRTYLDYRFSD
jgi:hypothetical protein